MKLGQFQSSETTYNTQECSNITDKNDKSQKLNFKDVKNLYTSDQQSDDSFELVILSYQHPENEQIKKEQVIVVYLKQLGIKMKTDPLEKQDKFYKNLKRRVNKSSTMSIKITQNNNEEDDNKEITQHKIQYMSLEMNSIIQRRTPKTTPQSSPLIIQNLEKLQEPLKKQRISIFQKIKGQSQTFSSDEEEIKDNIKRNQCQLSKEKYNGQNDQKNDFQN